MKKIIKSEGGSTLKIYSDSDSGPVLRDSGRITDPLPKLKPITTKAVTREPGLARRPSNEQRLLSIYNDAEKRKQISRDIGDHYAMRHFGTRPAGFKINSEKVSSISKFIDSRPIFKRRFDIGTGSSEDIETKLLSASDPENEAHKYYLTLRKRFNLLDDATPMPSKDGRLEVARQIENARSGIDFINRRREQQGLGPITDSITYSLSDLLDSNRSFGGGIEIGLSPKEKVKYGAGYLTTTRGVAAHEAGHANSEYNTNMIDTGDVYSDEELDQIFKDSPAYGNIYSNISPEKRQLLQYKWWRFPNKHNRELSEGYSDAVETQSNMNSLGYRDYSKESVRSYLNTDLGRGDRFVKLRGGKRGKWFDKLVDALNVL